MMGLMMTMMMMVMMMILVIMIIVALPSPRSIDAVDPDFEVISDEPFTLNISIKLKTGIALYSFFKESFASPD